MHWRGSMPLNASASDVSFGRLTGFETGNASSSTRVCAAPYEDEMDSPLMILPGSFYNDQSIFSHLKGIFVSFFSSFFINSYSSYTSWYFEHRHPVSLYISPNNKNVITNTPKIICITS